MPLTLDEFVKVNNEVLEEMMNNDKLWTVSDEALQAEIERRQKRADAPPRLVSMSVVPQDDLDAHRNFDVLRNACIKYVEQVLDDHPEPDGHWIEEAAMALFYGEGYWDWHSKRRT